MKKWEYYTDRKVIYEKPAFHSIHFRVFVVTSFFFSGCMMNSLQGFAQNGNEEILCDMMSRFLIQGEYHFRQYQGFTGADCLEKLTTDSLSDATLTIGTPRVTYQSLGKKRYLRRMDIRLKGSGEMAVDTTLSYTDTLSGKALRQYNRQSPENLRADDPTLLGKWVKPMMLIGVSVGGVISLFYIRSSL
ncbi:MAG: hypothetical protein R3C61_23475 [Bacteroidia bacterium]